MVVVDEDVVSIRAPLNRWKHPKAHAGCLPAHCQAATASSPAVSG
jgi:hypothetical protein